MSDGADGTIFELPSQEAAAQFLTDFRAWCFTEEAAKLVRQVVAMVLSS